MKKRILAWLLVVLMAVTLTACGNKKLTGQVLDQGWTVRGDVSAAGEKENWHKGFTKGNGEVAEIMWYANKFSATLADSDRVLMTASDLGVDMTLWINGKQIDQREDAAGSLYWDVTNAIKRNGANNVVLRAKGYADVDSIGFTVHPKMAVAGVSATVDGDSVSVIANMDNKGAKDDVCFTVEITALDSGKVMSRIVETVTVGEGNSQSAFVLSVPDHLKWTQDLAYLYHISVKAETTNGTDHGYATVGFADLSRDEEGYYQFNGKTTFLRAIDMPARVLSDDTTMRRFVDFVRTAEFNAVCPLIAPTKALLDYCDQTGMMVLIDEKDQMPRGVENHVSLRKVAMSDLAVMGEGLEFATAQPVDAINQMYKNLNLDRIYGGAIDLYKAMGAAYVERVSAAIGEARRNGAPAVRLAAGIDGYPDTMLLALADGIEELRYVMNVDSVIVRGGSVGLSVDLVDCDILWKGAKYEAYIKITNDEGIVWEKKVPFTTEITALGHSTARIPLLNERVPITTKAGKYTVAVELTDLAHPVCGEATFYVVENADLSSATIATGALNAEQIETAKNGGKVILLNASEQSNLPFDAEFVTGITGAVVDNRAKAAFGGTVIDSLGGEAFDCAIKAEGGTSYLSGFGVGADNHLVYGSVIATYAVGNGSITVVTADVDVNNPTVAAILAAAIA